MMVLRLLDFIVQWPGRLIRLLLWMSWVDRPHGNHQFLRWLSGLLMLIMDLTPAAWIYMTIGDWVKWKTRPLLAHEKQLALQFFGSSFPVHLVSVDTGSLPVRKGKTSAYVSFYTINGNEHIPSELLIHELVHVWQYLHFGSVYIAEAIHAQRWGGGYDYGGLNGLQQGRLTGGLLRFNFEQQADIIEEYYRWKSGLPLQWSSSSNELGSLLQLYVQDISRVA